MSARPPGGVPAPFSATRARRCEGLYPGGRAGPADFGGPPGHAVPPGSERTAFAWSLLSPLPLPSGMTRMAVLLGPLQMSRRDLVVLDRNDRDRARQLS